jgi:hypothetical protein
MLSGTLTNQCSLQGEPSADTDTLYDSAGLYFRQYINHATIAYIFNIFSSNGITDKRKLVNHPFEMPHSSVF